MPVKFFVKSELAPTGACATVTFEEVRKPSLFDLNMPDITSGQSSRSTIAMFVISSFATFALMVGFDLFAWNTISR
jgi:hypothetical protein